MNINDSFQPYIEQQQIPLNVSPDPFYSASNMAHLRRGINALNTGKGTEHDLIDVEDE